MVKGKRYKKKRKRPNYARRRRFLLYGIIIFIILIVKFVSNIVSRIESRHLLNDIYDKDNNNTNTSVVNEIDTNEVENSIAISDNNSNNEDNEEYKEFYKNGWNLILVNRDNKISNKFTTELVLIERGYKVDSRIIDDLKDMLNDARDAGMNPLICSAYRSDSYQTEVLEREIRNFLAKGYSASEAKEKAYEYVQKPGTSEHATGLALDIVDMDYQLLDKTQEDTETQKWLMENSYKYGFILRYLEGKEDITGINYEPWHYRYVGKEHAKKIHEKGITLEEYIESLK